MRTLGVDCATRTGLALVGDDEDRGKTVVLPEQRGYERLQLIADDVARTVKVWLPAFAAVEGFAYVRNVSSFVTVVEVGTMIRSVLYQARIPWVEVPPTVLKKWTTGSGRADKAEMAMAVKTRWNYQSPSHDIIDAYALAQMAQLDWDMVLTIQGVQVGWTNRSKE